MKPTPLNLILAALTLIAGLILTAIGVSQAYENNADEARFQFDRLSERLSAAVQRRMNQPVYGLKGARGIYAASQSVERLEFRAYAESRDLPGEFPGATGFGFIQRVMREDLDRFVAAERADSGFAHACELDIFLE